MFIDEITGQVYSANKIEKPEIIVIASSTGGPKALDVIYSMLPKQFDIPVVIVQHIIGNITTLLAKTPNEKYKLPIVVPNHGDPLEPGKIYIAAGNAHTVLGNGLHDKKIFKHKQSPPVNSVIPAADVTFISVAKNFAGKKVMAIVLTGIGKDGVDGVKALKENTDCLCLCEAESTCTIYGMSKNTVKEGLSDMTLPISDIGSVMSSVLSK
jgi:two-component system chemotaxis response regulator CheB